jgi:DNA-binding protein H-NS
LFDTTARHGLRDIAIDRVYTAAHSNQQLLDRMAKTYSDIKARIALLQAEAEKAREAEMAGVIARIREAIAVYGITADDLFGERPRRAAVTRPGTRAARYADDQGNTWGGRGPRPKWLREALADGRTLESFALNSGAKAAASRSRPKKSAAGASRGRGAGKSRRGGSVPVKYRDSDGNTWTGRGMQPVWVREAIAAGKSLESLRV